MSYDVQYEPEAEDELLEVWLNASDRSSVTRASDTVDRLLEADPYQGEHRSEALYRLRVPPLVVYYKIDQAKLTVRVNNVGELRNPPPP